MQRQDKKQEDSMPTGIAEEELKSCTCPISKSIILIPYKGSACGHVFEYEEISDHIKKIEAENVLLVTVNLFLI